MTMPPLSPLLPDLLGQKLRIVFCGTAAGPMSAAKGHYYAHPQNKFWKTLHEVGLTPYRLDPSEFRKLLEWRIGLTDIAKNVSGLDKDLPRESLGALACDSLRERIEEFQPGILAFTSQEAGKRFLRRKIALGEQKETVGTTRVWILPSSSPAGHWNWDLQWWKALAVQVKSMP
jgi:TDG/mug DNA glycosylase family protein